MKSRLLFLAVFLATCLVSAETLTLTWWQPAGFKSTLYTATNLNGEWTAFSEASPPVNVEPTNCVAFFKVVVVNTNTFNQPVVYVSDPNSESLKPFYTNHPALSYSLNAALSTYFWNYETQLWQ